MRISERSQKFNRSLKEFLPIIIQKILSPEEIGFLTISAVEISGDLEWADVFVSSIGTKNDFVQILTENSKKISHELQKKINGRRAMKLRFKLDKSVQRTEKMNTLL